MCVSMYACACMCMSMYICILCMYNCVNVCLGVHISACTLGLWELFISILQDSGMHFVNPKGDWMQTAHSSGLSRNCPQGMGDNSVKFTPPAVQSTSKD